MRGLRLVCLFVFGFCVVPLKDHRIVFLFHTGDVTIRHSRPHNRHGSQRRAEPDGPVPLIRAPGDKIRPGQKVAEAVGQQIRRHPGRTDLAMVAVAVGQLPPHHPRCQNAHQPYHTGIKTLDAVGAGVGFQRRKHRTAKLQKITAAVFVPAFDLHDQRRGGVRRRHRAQYIGKQRGVKANAFSEAAKAKIEALGGTCEVI